jgi:hypothetical protein
MKQQAKPYYVYVLREATGAPFYVGKGTGRRALNHIFGQDSCGGEEKANVVRAARESGVGLSIEIVGWFSEPERALAKEADLIAELGLRRDQSGPLTNLVGRGPSRTIGCRFPLDLYERAVAVAADDGLTLTDFILLAVRRHVDTWERRAA